MLTRAEQRAVDAARSYPWAEPPQPHRPGAVHDALARGFTALVAYGANASAAVLARKLAAAEPGTVRAEDVVVAPAVVLDADVVFSAHVSPHGAVPATIAPVTGTVVEVHVLAVPPAALPVLDATEPNYVRERARGVKLEGEVLAEVDAYVSRHGAARIDGAPAALAAIPARGRRLAAFTEEEVLERLRVRADPEATPDEFMLDQIRYESSRRERTRLLKAGL